MGKNTFKKGALLLMAAGFVVRILGFGNRIFMSNLIGAEGMGLFQLTSPIYSLIILTLTAGVSISVSSMTARERAKGNPSNARRIAKTGFWALLIVGIIVGAALALLSGFLSVKVLKDGRTYLSLIMLAPCIPIVAAASAIKGYFYGSKNVTPTAISQIVEQIVRIAFIFALAVKITGLGLEYACALATVSAAVGEMANLTVVAIAFIVENKREPKTKLTVRKREAAVEIAKYSWPVSANRFIISVMGAVETILIPGRFLAGGMAYRESIEALGRMSGMAMPLIAFPTLVTSALATTLVPAISEAVSIKNYRLANFRMSRCIKISFVMGFFFFGVFFVFGDNIGNFFYKNQNVGPMMVALSWCCILMYFQQIVVGIMNGLGKQGKSLINSMVGYGIRLGFIWFAIPKYGVQGYLWGSIASMVVVSAMDMAVIIKATGMLFDVRRWLIWPGICGVAIMMSGIILQKMSFFSGEGLKWIFAMGISCILGAGMLILTGSVRFKNLKDLL